LLDRAMSMEEDRTPGVSYSARFDSDVAVLDQIDATMPWRPAISLARSMMRAGASRSR